MAHVSVSPALVGRGQEVARILETARAAAGGEGRLLLLSGEAGIGKSRLLEEIEQRLAGNWRILRGHCYEQEISFPYSPWIDLLRQGFPRRVSSAPPPGAEQPPFSDAVQDRLARLLPELQIYAPTAEPSLLDDQNERQLLFNTILAWVHQEASIQPLVVELEDIHWSDEASLDLLRFIVRHIARSPVLILATYRSDEIRPALSTFLAEMDREHRAGELPLAPLTRPEVEQMACQLLGLPPGSSLRFLDPAFAWMEGNPFYIEEILHSLADPGSLAGPTRLAEPGRRAASPPDWEKAVFAKLRIPRSVQEAVRRRVDPLSGEARSLLILAAAAGQQFQGSVIESAAHQADFETPGAESSETGLLSLIHEMIDAQLIIELQEDTYAFRHALTREAVLAPLLAREKRILHYRVGKALEKLAAPNPQPYLADLAYHFYEAASWPEALEYARQAGERARRLYAPREAALHFSRALNAAQQLHRDPPVDCLVGRAHASELLGDFDRAREDYETAITLARGEDDLPKSASENAGLALECRLVTRLGFLWLARDFRRAGAYFQQALELARQQPDPALLAATLNRVGNWRLNQNQVFEAREYHEQALAIFERLRDAQGIGETLDLLGITNYLCGNMLQGAACFERAISIWQELGARSNLVQSLVHISFPTVVDTEIERPVDPAAQREYGETALRMAREMGWRSAEVEALATLANLSTVGEYDLSLEDTLAGLEIAREIDHHYNLALFYSHLGELSLDLFDLPAARQALQQSLKIARASGAEMFVIRSTALLAAGLIQAGELAEAEALLQPGMPGGPQEAQPRPGQSVFIRQAWRVRAELALAQGRPAEALRIIDLLIESAENGPARGDRAVPALARLRGEALAALYHRQHSRPAKGGQAQPAMPGADLADAAEAELQAAEELARLHHRLPLLWRAQVSLGKFYLAQKQAEQARRAFDSARQVIEQLAEHVPADMRQFFRERALSQTPGLNQAAQRPPKKARPGGLTERELEVAALVARGKSNREIAAELVVGVRTVEAHITRILTRLNFTSRTEIAVWAAANGLAAPGRGPEKKTPPAS